MKKYQKKANQIVVAVQINLDLDDLLYRKWGDQQKAKSGDWLVNNNGNVYTIDEQVFDRTYQQVSPGLYKKIAVIYATVADQSGSVETLEGRTHYLPGDYLVYEQPEQQDGAYAISKDQFESMYEEVAE